MILEKKKQYLDDYFTGLKKEIYTYAQVLWKQSVDSLYFGGGTPLLLWKQQLLDIVALIYEQFDMENIGEISFEMNPYPQDQVYDFIQTFQDIYKKVPRIRRSFGIQTFDNEILQDTWRNSTFPGLVDFLRWLRPLKRQTTVFNFDFIAFGKFHTTKTSRYFWNEQALKFFSAFVNSYFADSFSVYVLELFSWSLGHERQKIMSTSSYFGSDDEIYEEFSTLKNMLMDAGYHRYEISNFCQPGKWSVHNSTYWSMQNYIGFGTSAASFIKGELLENIRSLPAFAGVSPAWLQGLRWTNTINILDYVKGNTVDPEKIVPLKKKDFLAEQFFLALRTQQGIDDIKIYESVLIPDYQKKLEAFEKLWLVYLDGDLLALTDKGMDLYNTIVTDLLAYI